jgi:hypothetical protein
MSVGCPSSALSVYSGNTLVPAQPGVTTTALVGGAVSNKIVVPPPSPLPPTLSDY